MELKESKKAVEDSCEIRRRGGTRGENSGQREFEGSQPSLQRRSHGLMVTFCQAAHDRHLGYATRFPHLNFCFVGSIFFFFLKTFGME